VGGFGRAGRKNFRAAGVWGKAYQQKKERRKNHLGGGKRRKNLATPKTQRKKEFRGGVLSMHGLKKGVIEGRGKAVKGTAAKNRRNPSSPGLLRRVQGSRIGGSDEGTKTPGKKGGNPRERKNACFQQEENLQTPCTHEDSPLAKKESRQNCDERAAKKEKEEKVNKQTTLRVFRTQQTI